MSLKVSDSQPIQLVIAHFCCFSEKHEVLKGVACLSPMKERNYWDNHKGGEGLEPHDRLAWVIGEVNYFS